MNNSIKITKPAWNKIINVLNQTKKPAFFLSLTGGGCNGYSYDFKIIEAFSKGFSLEYDA